MNAWLTSHVTLSDQGCGVVWQHSGHVISHIRGHYFRCRLYCYASLSSPAVLSFHPFFPASLFWAAHPCLHPYLDRLSAPPPATRSFDWDHSRHCSSTRETLFSKSTALFALWFWHKLDLRFHTRKPISACFLNDSPASARALCFTPPQCCIVWSEEFCVDTKARLTKSARGSSEEAVTSTVQLARWRLILVPSSFTKRQIDKHKLHIVL